MNRKFPLFQSHLDLAHDIWMQIIDHVSVVIDCTCGNGHDAAFIASHGPQRLYCLDIQDEAIMATRDKVSEFQCDVVIKKQCHSHFPEEIQQSTADLIVYNLGYLPGADKSKTTRVETTLKSLDQACRLLKPGGVISITCYPGHPEGTKEELAILEWGQALDPAAWCVTVHQFKNRKQSPSLVIIQMNVL